MMNQSTFETPRVAAPGEPHLACLLLLDTSGSMSGAPIDSLNKAINDFKEKTMMDEMAKKRVDVAIMQFDDDVSLVQDFTPIADMKPVNLTTGGMTNMGKAILEAIEKVKERNRFYASLGTPCYQPWIFLITDGGPTDDITAAANKIAEESSKGTHGKLKFWAVGVPGYNETSFRKLCPEGKRMLALENADFSGIFNWLSESMATISVSRIGENPKLSDLPDNAHVIPSDW